MNELRDIPGFEGRYAAAADGRIWSHGRGIWLKQWRNGTGGYLGVELDGETRRAHRLIALAWLPNPDALPQVNHLNGVKTDNRVANLEWCTGSENMRHAVQAGLVKPPRGFIVNNARRNRLAAKLTAERVSIIKARLARGDLQKDIAADYKVTPPNISAISRGLTWRDVAPAVLA